MLGLRVDGGSTGGLRVKIQRGRRGEKRGEGGICSTFSLGYPRLDDAANLPKSSVLIWRMLTFCFRGALHSVEESRDSHSLLRVLKPTLLPL